MKRLTIGWLAVALGAAFALGCADEIDAGGDGLEGPAEDDPLTVDAPAPAGSLEDLQRTIISARCSGQRGLCHNGQFEPNLSTVGNTYNWLVRRPALENTGRMRVNPGDPASSFLIDKLRNRNGVATQMPLGAEPLGEDDIAKFEAWIANGALRAPGADPAEALNNPPRTPELRAFEGQTRIDTPGIYTVAVGTTVTFRHSVDDFETADDQIFVAGLILSTDQGNVAMSTDPVDDFAETTLDTGSPPQGNGDVLNYTLDFTFGDMIDLIGPNDTIVPTSTDGLAITPVVLYLDVDPTAGGIVAVRFPENSLMVQP